MPRLTLKAAEGIIKGLEEQAHAYAYEATRLAISFWDRQGLDQDQIRAEFEHALTVHFKVDPIRPAPRMPEIEDGLDDGPPVPSRADN